MDKLSLARNAVIELYNQQGMYNTKALDEILEGLYDDTFVIRAIVHALGKVENG